MHGASCGTWRLANQVLVSGKNCCNQRQAIVVALKATCRSSKPWSQVESMEILRSKFCALWRSWPPRRLDRSCSMASRSFGCSECCTLAVTCRCFELKGALKIAMHDTDLSVLSKQEHRKSRKRETVQTIRDVLDMFRVSLGLCLDMFLLDHSGPALLPVEARKPTCAKPAVEISQIFFMTSFSMLCYSRELKLFDI